MEKQIKDQSIWSNSVITSVEINTSLKKAYETVYNSKPRPNYLPHLNDVHIIFDDGIVQEYYYITPNTDSGKQHARTISRCDGNVIEFFQPEPPEFMSSYFVKWIFEELSEGTCKIIAENYWNLNNNSNKYFPEDKNLSTIQKASQHILAYSSKALEVIKEKFE